MQHPSNEDWQDVLETFRPDVLQTDAEDFNLLDVPDEIQRWPVHREKEKVSGTYLGEEKVSGTFIGTFIYEGARSGRGETVDWGRAAEVARDGKMILAGGLSAVNVAEAIATVRPFGVDVSSAVESAPGEKDPAMIKEFVSAARAAEKKL